MKDSFDLVIKNVRLFGEGNPVHVGISEGKIAEISSTVVDGRLKIEGKGNALIPGFINAHTHLDKAGLFHYMKPEHFGHSLEENRELLKVFKRRYSLEEIKKRAMKVCLDMLTNGFTAIRTQVDVDCTAGLKPLQALLELREEIKSLIHIEISAFPQEGVLSKENQQLIECALELGATVIGGNPMVEPTHSLQQEHIDILFEIAKKFDKHLDIQVDESNDPQHFLLPYLAKKTAEHNYQGKVAATHCISLSAVVDAAREKTIRGLAHNRISVIVTPSANLITKFVLPDGPYQPHNSITRVKELLAAGVNVCLGTDNIQDIFYPWGDCNPLREIHVLAVATRMTGYHDGKNLFTIATLNGAKLLGMDYGLEVGRKADLVVLNGKTLHEALCSLPVILWVIKDGKIRVKNRGKNMLYKS